MKLVKQTLVVLVTSTIFLGSMVIVTAMIMYPPHYIQPKSVSAVPSEVAPPEEKYSEIEKDLRRACWSIQDPQKALDCINSVERRYPH